MATSSNFSVFINFRGELRSTFISHLYDAFLRKGIKPFIDSEELHKGEQINVLMERIEQSKTAVVVLSENYSTSRWCLDELAKIMECWREKKLKVIPVFYGVPVSDVKHQTGKFREPFKKWAKSFRESDREKVSTWRKALEAVGELSGFNSTENGDESKFIADIVNDVLSKLNRQPSDKREGLFGINTRLKQLEEKLCFGLGGVRVVGVVGMAGIGKTTVADYLYQKMRSEFDGFHFCRNVREESKNGTLGQLLKVLLEKLLNDNNLDIGAPEYAHEALKERLLNKKMLIVLDDVSDKRQIKVLLARCDWLREGSRVIITTTDKKLISNLVLHTPVVQGTYIVPKLNDSEALQLFCYNAFTDHICPDDEFMKLSKTFVDYAKGNPLALNVLGSSLCQRDYNFWQTKIDKLHNDPDREIQEVLKTSYDDLSLELKSAFLDIACFFRSEKRHYVESLLDASGIGDAAAAINDLSDKCMITISNNLVEMHDLLQTMGKQIRKDDNLKRLWNHKDVCQVLKTRAGNEAYRGIFLDMSEVKVTDLSSKPFKRMSNLRYLKFFNSRCPQACEVACKFRFPGGLKFPHHKLTYLHWQGYPLNDLPSEFDPENLVDLRLPYSQTKQLWEDTKKAEKLKWIDLSHSQKLRDLSGLSEAPNLEKLNLECCRSLDSLLPLIKNLNRLISLNLKECTSLESLPLGINLGSLKTLILSGCSNLKEFHPISDKLETLYLDGTAINELPESIENLCKLVLLNLKNCSKLKHLPNGLCKLKLLEELVLSGCSNIQSFPNFEERMDSLKVLLLDGTSSSNMQDPSSSSGYKRGDFMHQNLSKLLDEICKSSILQVLCLCGNEIESIPASIKQLDHLKWLDLKHCKKLSSLPMLPLNLQWLDADGCDSLEIIESQLMPPMSTQRIHTRFTLTNCYKLAQSAQDNLVSYAQMKSQLMANARNRCSQGFVLDPLVEISFPGSEIPLWFCYQTIGSSLDAKLSPHWRDRKFVGFSLCAVVSFKNYANHSNCFSIKCACDFKCGNGEPINFTCCLGGWNDSWGAVNEPRRLQSDHVFLGYNGCFHIEKSRGENDLNRCCHTTASFKFYVTDDTSTELQNCEVVKCGLSLLYAQYENDSLQHGIPDGIQRRDINLDMEGGKSGDSSRDSDQDHGGEVQQGDQLSNGHLPNGTRENRVINSDRVAECGVGQPIRSENNGNLGNDTGENRVFNSNSEQGYNNGLAHGFLSVFFRCFNAS